MRIQCPHCGERDAQEFAYLGDATLVRPEGMSAEQDAVYNYVYVRDNPAGPHHEYWYHASGCHSWLVVTRNTLTHAITGVERAADVTLRRQNGAAS
jgi:methylglutamate dehydrogenase subunit B